MLLMTGFAPFVPKLLTLFQVGHVCTMQIQSLFDLACEVSNMYVIQHICDRSVFAGDEVVCTPKPPPPRTCLPDEQSVASQMVIVWRSLELPTQTTAPGVLRLAF